MDLEPVKNDHQSFEQLALNTSIATTVAHLAVNSLPKYPTLQYTARDMLALLNEAVREGVAIGTAFATIRTID